MTLTKKIKRILCIAFPAGAILLAAAIFLWLWLGQTREEYKPFDIRRDQNTNAIIYCAVKGEVDQTTAANLELPCYELHLSEGWTQTENAMEGYVPDTLPRSYVNMTWDWYCDRYQSPEGVKLTFGQRPAGEQLLTRPDSTDSYSISGNLDPASIQEVQFGDTQVIYYQQPDSDLDENWNPVKVTCTGVYWVHDQSLLHLSCTQAMEVNQMLELISRVDYQAQREPIAVKTEVVPLTLVPGRVINETKEDGSVWSSTESYRSEGSPAVPDQPQLLAFSPPEGYTLDGSWAEFGYSIREKYRNEEGELISYSCCIGPGQFFKQDNGNGQLYFPFQGISWEELADPNSVQEAQVNGNPAFVHINDDVAEIGWIDGYCTLQIRCTAPMTQEELIALAEAVA